MPDAKAPETDKQGVALMPLDHPLLQIEDEGFDLGDEQGDKAPLPGEGQQEAKGGNEPDVAALLAAATGQPQLPVQDPIGVDPNQLVQQQLQQSGWDGDLPALLKSQGDGHQHVTQLNQQNALLRQQLAQQQQTQQQIMTQMNQLLSNQQQQQNKGLSNEELNAQFESDPLGAIDYKLNQFTNKLMGEMDSRLSRGLEGQAAYNQMTVQFPELLNPTTPLGQYGPRILDMIQDAPAIVKTLALQGLNNTLNDPQRMMQDYSEGKNVGKQEALLKRNAMTEQPSAHAFAPQANDAQLRQVYNEWGGKDSGLSFNDYKKLVGNKQKQQAANLSHMMGGLSG